MRQAEDPVLLAWKLVFSVSGRVGHWMVGFGVEFLVSGHSSPTGDPWRATCSVEACRLHGLSFSLLVGSSLCYCSGFMGPSSWCMAAVPLPLRVDLTTAERLVCLRIGVAADF